MYKRAISLLCILLAAVTVMTACSAAPAASSSEAAVSVFAPADTSVSQPDPEPEFPYTNPLTGLGTYTDLSADRPIAIMINNLKKALPQLGVSQADIIYEAPAEGGITRMMAVFQTLDQVGDLGSVRSARPYYVELAAGLDAIFIHAGGSDDAYSAIKNYGVFNIDGVNGPYGGTMFWRDAARKKNAGFEHSLLTSPERITKLLTGSLAKSRQTHKEGYSLPLYFTEDGTPVNGSPANTVSVRYSNYKTGLFRYDEQTGTYLAEQYGAAYVDGNNDRQIAVTNVLILATSVRNIPGDTAGRKSIKLTGSGSGWFACGGKYIPITWAKDSANAPFRYYTADGQDLMLGAGKTYVNIVGTDYPVTFE